tara:strand:- start:497 stop:700 length:204 start_codon:yes stop_codon:yes gene_type:complete
MDQDQDQEQLLAEALAFCQRRGLSDSAWGATSPVNDTHLMGRLRAGRLRRDTVNRVRRWMVLADLTP